MRQQGSVPINDCGRTKPPQQSPIKKQELWPSGRRWDFQINGQPANINILWQDLQNSQAVLIKRYFCGHRTVACIPLYPTVCILLSSSACVCVCVRGCTLDKVYSFLGDNFVSFAVGKRETHTHTQATSRRASLANHPSMPQRLETKAGLCLPSKLRRRPRRRLRLWETETPVEVHSQLATVAAPEWVGSNVHLIWIWNVSIVAATQNEQHCCAAWDSDTCRY